MNEKTKKTEKPEAGKALEAKVITLKELGPNLPLGIPKGEAFARDVAVRPWRYKEEKELGALREEDQSQSVAQYVTTILAVMCTSLGGHNFEQMKPIERRVIISQMWMGDVFYAYMWLRIQALGNILPVTLVCRTCNHEFPFDANLETTEVRIAESMEAVNWEYKLYTPITIRGEKVKAFKMGPARWGAMETLGDAAMDTGKAKGAIIAGSICGIVGDDTPMVVTESELEELVKLDIETLTKKLDDSAIGPNMSIECSCKRCRRTLIQAISWGYDNFFGISSR